MITAPNFTIAQSFEPLLTQHIAIEGIYSYLRLYNPETDDIYSPFSQIEWENMFPNVTHNDFKEWASYIDRVILLACDKSTDMPFGMVCIVEDFDQLGSVCFHGGTWCHTPSFTLKMYDSLVNMLDTLIHLGYSITAMCLSNNSKADKLQRSLGFVEYRNDGVKSYKKFDQSKFINSPYYQKFNTSDHN